MPILWFEEGIDELGPEIINEVSQAVTQPPQYKSYILFILLGVTNVIKPTIMVQMVTPK